MFNSDFKNSIGILLLLIAFFPCSKTFSFDYQDTNIKNDIILPFYPFKHHLTYKADSLFLIDSNEEAIKQYSEANVYFLNQENWEGAAYTSNMIAEIYTNRLYNFDAARHHLELSMEYIGNYMGEDHPLNSDTYLTFASYSSSLGSASEEQEYLKKSMAIRNTYYGPQSIQVAEVYYRMGQMYQFSYSFNEQAKEYYDRALIINEEYLATNHPDLIKVYYALGSIYRYLEDFQRARIYMDHAIYKYTIDSLRNLRRLANSFTAKGNIFNKLYRFENAVVYYNLGITILKDIYGESNPQLLLPYMGIGVGYLRLKEYDSALLFLNKSLDIYKKNYSTEDPYEEYAMILTNKGECFSYGVNYDSAKNYLFKSLKLKENTFHEDKSSIAYAYNVIAEMYNNFENYDSALYYSQKALKQIHPESDNYMDPSSETFYEYDLNLLIDIYTLWAKVLVNKFELNTDDHEILVEALEIYHILDKILDNIRSSELAQESKLIASSNFHKVYNEAINCASHLYSITYREEYLEDILSFFEKNKYMLLLQNLELSRKSNELNIPFEYKYKEDSLEMLLASKVHSTASNDSIGINLLDPESYAIDMALQKLRKEIESNYPNYYKFEIDSLAITLSQLKEYAKTNKCLMMEFFVNDSTINLIAIDPVLVTIYQIKRDQYLNNAINQYLNIVSNVELSDNIQEQYLSFRNSANLIYNILISPVFANHDVQFSENLIIAPDGILAQIPFEALVKEIPESDFPDYADLEYLILTNNISYVYSFNLLLKIPQTEKDKKNNLLGFSYSGIEVSKNPEKRSDEMIELPGTKIEIEAIKSIVKGDNLFFEDEEATETQFKDKAKHYQILHLAVHGLGDFESNVNSRLVFKNQNDSLNDGNLFLYELINIDLSRSKLAILSACETGIGKEFKGEGVFSIARGFANSGCPSMIMSLWKINDQVSSDILTKFYKNLRKGQYINEALRNAKIEFLKSSEALNSHPANWAALVPMGYMDPVYEKSIKIFMVGIIIGLFILIPTILFFLNKLRPKYKDLFT